MGISRLSRVCCELIFGTSAAIISCYQFASTSTCSILLNATSALRWPHVLFLRGAPRLFEAPGLVPGPPGRSKLEAGIHLLPGPGIPHGASVVGSEGETSEL